MLYLHFYKAQGPQAFQGSDYIEKTPPNMLCDTSITLLRDDYPTGSVHLFHF